MKYSLKVYVDSLFNDVPPSDAVTELHDEMLTNLEERYDDCINGGMSPQRAYAAVIGTMGDVESLIKQVSGTGMHTQGLFEKASPRSILIRKYSYIFTNENLKEIKGAAIAVMWLMIVVAYFVFSELFGLWDISWLIFLFGAALTVGINMASSIAKISRSGESDQNRIRLLKSIRGGATAIMWLAITMIYFIISTVWNSWNNTWLIFIFGAMAQIIMNTVFKIQINRYK